MDYGFYHDKRRFSHTDRNKCRNWSFHLSGCSISTIELSSANHKRRRLKMQKQKPRQDDKLEQALGHKPPSLTDRLNPKKAIEKKMMQKALTQLSQMDSKAMFEMFQEKLMPFFAVNPNVEVKATKLKIKGKSYYGIILRDA